MYHIADAHTDLLTALKPAQQIVFIHNLPTNVKALNLAVFTTDNNLSITGVEKLKNQVEDLQQHTKTHLLFSVEDIGPIKPNEIETLIKLKPFCVSLTWNYKNQYAGGAFSTSGITKYGKDIIKKLEENNIIIDSAHLNRKSFWQFTKITTKPILCTHANINSLFNHQRNLTDKQIKRIIESNGFIGITLYEKFISNTKISAKDVATQFDYLIKKFGHKNFGFGTDFFGINKTNLPKDTKTYENLQLIAIELKKLGYNNETINCIFNNNFTNFLKRTNNINFKC